MNYEEAKGRVIALNHTMTGTTITLRSDRGDLAVSHPAGLKTPEIGDRATAVKYEGYPDWQLSSWTGRQQRIPPPAPTWHEHLLRDELGDGPPGIAERAVGALRKLWRRITVVSLPRRPKGVPRDDDSTMCVDCGCELPSVDPNALFRCDTCRDHYTEDCGEDCPVICTTCKKHHFQPWNEECRS